MILAKRVFVGVAGLAFAAMLVRGAVLLLTPNFNVASEANGLNGILELADNKPLYPPRTQRPYHIFLYPPVHALAGAAVIKMGQITALYPRVLSVRFLSLICFLGAVLLLWKPLVRKEGVGTKAFVFALLIMTSKFADYFTSSRNDMFCLLIEMLAVAVFVGWIREGQRRALALFLVLSILAVWTRQTGLEIFLAGATWLLLSRRFKTVFTLGVVYAAVNGLILYLLVQTTDGRFWEQVVLSNVRGWRPFNRQLFDASFITFWGSYVLYGGLLLYAITRTKPQKGSVEEFLFLCVVCSTGLAGSVFLRAGGDVNYFFFPIFVGVFFVAREIGKMGERRWLYGAATAQLLFVALVCGVKSRSAYESARIPFAEASARITKEFPPYVYITGYHGQSLSIYLRNQTLHGPDVTNAGYVAKNAHPTFRWLLKDVDKAIASGEASAVIVATQDCEHGVPAITMDWDPHLHSMEVWYPWLCVYRSREVETKSEVARVNPSSVGVMLN